MVRRGGTRLTIDVTRDPLERQARCGIFAMPSWHIAIVRATPSFVEDLERALLGAADGLAPADEDGNRRALVRPHGILRSILRKELS
jgi:hypothetical protein